MFLFFVFFLLRASCVRLRNGGRTKSWKWLENDGTVLDRRRSNIEKGDFSIVTTENFVVSLRFAAAVSVVVKPFLFFFHLISPSLLFASLEAK